MKRILFLVLAILCLTSKAFCDQPRAIVYGLNNLTPVPIAVDAQGNVILSNAQPTLIPTATPNGKYMASNSLTTTANNGPCPANYAQVFVNAAVPTTTVTPIPVYYKFQP